MTLSEELRTKKSRDNRELLDRAANEIERLQDSLRLAVALLTTPKGDGGIKKYGGYVEVTDVLDLPSALTNEEKVSELLLINEDKSNNFDVKSNKQIEEVAQFMAEIAHLECGKKPCEECKWLGRGNDKADCTDYLIAEHLYNAGYRKQEWISVDERLPEKNGQYLVTNGKKITIEQFSYPDCLTKFDTPSFCFWDNSGDGWWRKLDFPTHWMPLPEAPKMKGGEE